MRSIVFISCIALVIFFWLFTLAVLGGIIATDLIQVLPARIELPHSTAELGDSLNIFVGLISTITMLIAVHAVRLQAKALGASIQAQNDQQRALTDQLARQEIISLIGSYTAQIQVLASDRQWYQHLIDQYRSIRESQTDPAKQQDTHDKITRCQNRNKDIKSAMAELSRKVEALSSKLEKSN